jgi:hypothetical protein
MAVSLLRSAGSLESLRTLLPRGLAACISRGTAKRSAPFFRPRDNPSQGIPSKHVGPFMATSTSKQLQSQSKRQSRTWNKHPEFHLTIPSFSLSKTSSCIGSTRLKVQRTRSIPRNLTGRGEGVESARELPSSTQLQSKLKPLLPARRKRRAAPNPIHRMAADYQIVVAYYLSGSSYFGLN